MKMKWQGRKWCIMRNTKGVYEVSQGCEVVLFITLLLWCISRRSCKETSTRGMKAWGSSLVAWTWCVHLCVVAAGYYTCSLCAVLAFRPQTSHSVLFCFVWVQSQNEIHGSYYSLLKWAPGVLYTQVDLFHVHLTISRANRQQLETVVTHFGVYAFLNSSHRDSDTPVHLRQFQRDW